MTTATQTIKRVALPLGATLLQKLSRRVAQRVVAGWAAVQALVPMGYEDEHGFHYGVAPGANRNRPDQTA